MNWQQSKICYPPRVCGARTHPAPLTHIPPESAQSTVMLAAVADNMWVKQAAVILDAHPYMQPTHDSMDEEDHGSPSPKKQCT